MARTISTATIRGRERGSYRQHAYNDAFSRRAAFERLEWMANLLDSAIVLPGGVRVGLDAVVGLVPGIGDTITTLISLWMVREAHALGVPRHVTARMVGNVAIDALVGAVPLFGDVFDVFWRANKRNMKLLRAHFEREGLL